MATTAYTLLDTWDAVNRYTAAGETDVILSNTGGRVVTWTLTTNNLKPAVAISQGHPLLPYLSQAMKLKDGERLWMAGAGATASLGV
ncbi:hypothetical protein QO034_11825 [Sedimentitalea sp. JM2-8]|uniref:Uncharacterized protein n=1 Tax=Sedimentitalea xiamensis TaxID=3050037 RepID=A0ABT7FFP8_9RHOB|nr:hypothetical protein [Sedimentitalea xiamensis]MDK3073803.1 hypothetical protein [Sedimentitalea xiamensis]